MAVVKLDNIKDAGLEPYGDQLWWWWWWWWRLDRNEGLGQEL
jgi:hypothetical protein